MNEPKDAYTSVEAALYTWFEERGLYPGRLGRGAVQDLAVRVSEMIEPFRNFYRASEGWEDYDLEECRKAAKKAEEE